MRRMALGWLIVLALLSLDALCYLLESFSGKSLATWQHSSTPIWGLPVVLIGIAWLLATRGMPASWVDLVGLMPLVFDAPTPIPAGEAGFPLLDVDQGLAAVGQTQNHVLVFDTGPCWDWDGVAFEMLNSCVAFPLPVSTRRITAPACCG